MNLSDLDFQLPPALIAQHPTPDRAASRLLHYRRDAETLSHRHFSDLPDLLRDDDLLVMNDARVVPAKFTLVKGTGGRVEGLFLGQTSPGVWSVLLKNLGTTRPDAVLHFGDAPDVTARVVRRGEGGEVGLQVSTDRPAVEFLESVGRMPLPPYIKRQKDHDDSDDEDRERYQTVYANASGSVAAPTAGLHFTEELLGELARRGVERTFLTLHVGLGTFKPVTVERLADHVMHTESYEIGPEAAAAMNRAKSERRRIVAVGTTSARVIESQPADQEFRAKIGETNIFIYPPYAWKHVGALVTNFHLPKSTLVALVAAFVGLDEQRRIYSEAVRERYRFFSFGDASFLE
jgi:S-adenosylmethionine:tRNA ribosyltransferase-isomerase